MSIHLENWLDDIISLIFTFLNALHIQKKMDFADDIDLVHTIVFFIDDSIDALSKHDFVSNRIKCFYHYRCMVKKKD